MGSLLGWGRMQILPVRKCSVLNTGPNSFFLHAIKNTLARVFYYSNPPKRPGWDRLEKLDLVIANGVGLRGQNILSVGLHLKTKERVRLPSPWTDRPRRGWCSWPPAPDPQDPWLAEHPGKQLTNFETTKKR